MHCGSDLQEKEKETVDKGRVGVCFFDRREEKTACALFAGERGSWKQCTLAVTCRRKSRKQLIKAEWECVCFCRDRKKACASLAEGGS